ncbi:mCG144653, partial [Mus musculus]
RALSSLLLEGIQVLQPWTRPRTLFHEATTKHPLSLSLSLPSPPFSLGNELPIHGVSSSVVSSCIWDAQYQEPVISGLHEAQRPWIPLVYTQWDGVLMYHTTRYPHGAMWKECSSLPAPACPEHRKSDVTLIFNNSIYSPMPIVQQSPLPYSSHCISTFINLHYCTTLLV